MEYRLYEITFELSDGTKKAVRFPVPQGGGGGGGGTGEPGEDGVGIEDITISDADESGQYTLNFAMSDGTTQSVQFTAPRGENGATGATGAKGADGKTPVKGTDYWTQADRESIVSEVIDLLGGAPISGIVQADKTIVLSGVLGDGTYTFKYEDEDGTITEIGTLNHTYVPEPTYTNVIPAAVAYDGKPLNGVGYIDGYRLTSQQTVASNLSYLSSLSGYFATGFIPYTNAQAKDCVPFYIKGVNLDSLDDNMRIYMFESYTSAEYSEACKLTATGLNGVTITKLADSYYKITPKMNFYGNGEWATRNTKYIRFSFKGSGSGVILTINEPIE